MNVAYILKIESVPDNSDDKGQDSHAVVDYADYMAEDGEDIEDAANVSFTWIFSA